jgi:hypothetical protein
MNTSRRRALATAAMTIAATQSVSAFNLGNLLRRLALPVGPGAASAAGDMPAFKVERWVNSTPLTADMLRGKVVLVDFWEYTCVNWIRTSPYVKAWHRDYGDRGLVIVGFAIMGSPIRSHSTTILRHGRPSATTPGRQSTSSMPTEHW